METETSALLGACRAALDGEGFDSADFLSKVPDPKHLSRTEKAAWIKLRFWEDEATNSLAHPALMQSNRSRLQSLLSRLESPSSWRSTLSDKRDHDGAS